MVVCEEMNDFDVYIGSVRWASRIARASEVPAMPSSKEALDGVYKSSDSERLRARWSMGVAASVDIGHVGVGTTTR